MLERMAPRVVVQKLGLEAVVGYLKLKLELP